MKRIMIVDDELLILDLLKSFLDRKGKYHVDTFSNLDSALINAKNGIYDLILFDILNPSISGVSILEEIKKTNPSIKVILTTAYNTQDVQEQCKLCNIDVYLEKPFKNLSEIEKNISILI